MSCVTFIAREKLPQSQVRLSAFRVGSRRARKGRFMQVTLALQKKKQPFLDVMDVEGPPYASQGLPIGHSVSI